MLAVQHCALEIALHREWYDASDARYCAPFKVDNRIIVVPYSELCESVTLDGQYSDILCILALSSVVEIPIQMYFPPLNASFDTQPLTRLIIGRSVPDSSRHIQRVTIMWTTMQCDAYSRWSHSY